MPSQGAGPAVSREVSIHVVVAISLAGEMNLPDTSSAEDARDNLTMFRSSR